VLGIKLPIPRGLLGRTICFYVSLDELHYIEEAVSAFPGKGQSQAIMTAMRSWSKHRAALAEWKKEHPGNRIEG